MIVFVYFVEIIQKQMQIFQIIQQSCQLILSLTFHYSFFSTSKNDHNTPTIKNINAKIIATIDVFKSISFFTKGCIIENTKKQLLN